MLTESQKRALRAKALLDVGGANPKQIAQECGYTSVNAMLGAIAMCDGIPASHTPAAKPDIQAMTREEHAKRHPFREKNRDSAAKSSVYKSVSLTPTSDGVTLKATLYPVEEGIIWIKKPDITVSYRPESSAGPTVHINDEMYRRRTGRPKWLALVGKDAGSKEAIVDLLRQIAEAANECAALIEDEIKGGR